MKRTFAFNLTGLLFILFTVTCRAGGIDSFSHSGGIAYFKITSAKGAMDEINSAEFPFILMAKPLHHAIVNRTIYLGPMGRDSVIVETNFTEGSNLFKYKGNIHDNLSNPLFAVDTLILKPNFDWKSNFGYLFKFVKPSTTDHPYYPTKFAGDSIEHAKGIGYYMISDDKSVCTDITALTPFHVFIVQKSFDLIEVPIYIKLLPNSEFQLSYLKNGKEYSYTLNLYQQIDLPDFSINMTMSRSPASNDFTRHYFFKIEP